MPTREEIREGVELMVSDCVYGLAKSPMSSEDIVEELFNYLHSQGVVIKVEGELPQPEQMVVFQDAYETAYRHCKEDMLKWHNDSLVPLIEDVKYRGSNAKYVEPFK